ncbi:hypothetical protein DFS34DRAFT_649800 [Phlyctochytrium arcticum]|nr:hypothetical protein DFS34DRAFT_649800 [Phlyctochytrium arcticum]
MPPMSLHKHVPLIKFLGPRQFLPSSSASASSSRQSVQHPSSSSSSAQKSSPPASTPTSSTSTSTSKPTRHGNAVFYSSRAEMPRRFQPKVFTARELEVIDAGGADFVIKTA